jgi:hypothetical protein
MVASATVNRAIRGRRVARANGRQGAPDSVRCTNCPRGPTVDTPEKEGDRAPDSCSDCPVVHRTVRCTTRQKASLAFLDWSPTAPSCLGAIKGTPRHTEESHNLSSSLLLCAWVCCDMCLVCVAYPNLTPCFHCDLCCKGERLQSCGDSSQTGIII